MSSDLKQNLNEWIKGVHQLYLYKPKCIKMKILIVQCVSRYQRNSAENDICNPFPKYCIEQR